MARSVQEESPVAQDLESDYESEPPVESPERLQHPVDAADKNKNRPRPSLATQEPDFDYLYFQESYEKNPKRLFERILEALERCDQAEEKIKDLEEEALE